MPDSADYPPLKYPAAETETVLNELERVVFGLGQIEHPEARADLLRYVLRRGRSLMGLAEKLARETPHAG